jgi:hypothetical protein
MALQRVGSLVPIGMTAALIVVILGWVGPAPKAALSREKVRLELLDTCVVDEWRKRQNKNNIVDECKCVAAAVSTKFSNDDVASFEEELSRAQKPWWDAAREACFK